MVEINNYGVRKEISATRKIRKERQSCRRDVEIENGRNRKEEEGRN